jgi:hypothetical protein
MCQTKSSITIPIPECLSSLSLSPPPLLPSSPLLTFQLLSGEKNKGNFCYYAYIYKDKCPQENKEQYDVRT